MPAPNTLNSLLSQVNKTLGTTAPKAKFTQDEKIFIDPSQINEANSYLTKHLQLVAATTLKYKEAKDTLESMKQALEDRKEIVEDQKKELDTQKQYLDQLSKIREETKKLSEALQKAGKTEAEANAEAQEAADKKIKSITDLTNKTISQKKALAELGLIEKAYRTEKYQVGQVDNQGKPVLDAKGQQVTREVEERKEYFRERELSASEALLAARTRYEKKEKEIISAKEDIVKLNKKIEESEALVKLGPGAAVAADLLAKSIDHLAKSFEKYIKQWGEVGKVAAKNFTDINTDFASGSKGLLSTTASLTAGMYNVKSTVYDVAMSGAMLGYNMQESSAVVTKAMDEIAVSSQGALTAADFRTLGEDTLFYSRILGMDTTQTMEFFKTSLQKLNKTEKEAADDLLSIRNASDQLNKSIGKTVIKSSDFPKMMTEIATKSERATLNMRSLSQVAALVGEKMAKAGLSAAKTAEAMKSFTEFLAKPAEEIDVTAGFKEVEEYTKVAKMSQQDLTKYVNEKFKAELDGISDVDARNKKRLEIEQAIKNAGDETVGTYTRARAVSEALGGTQKGMIARLKEIQNIYMEGGGPEAASVLVDRGVAKDYQTAQAMQKMMQSGDFAQAASLAAGKAKSPEELKKQRDEASAAAKATGVYAGGIDQLPGNIWEALMNHPVLSVIFTLLGAAATAYIANQKLKSTVAIGKGLIDGFKEEGGRIPTIKSIASSGGEIIKNVGTKIYASAASLMDYASSGIQRIVQFSSSAASSLMRTISSFSSTVVSSLSSIVSNVGTVLSNFGAAALRAAGGLATLGAVVLLAYIAYNTLSFAINTLVDRWEEIDLGAFFRVGWSGTWDAFKETFLEFFSIDNFKNIISQIVTGKSIDTASTRVEASPRFSSASQAPTEGAVQREREAAASREQAQRLASASTPGLPGVGSTTGKVNITSAMSNGVRKMTIIESRTYDVQGMPTVNV